MEKQSLQEGWTFCRVGSEEIRPAVVPGSVYTDMLRNGQMEDPFYRDNEKEALRLMEEDYEYCCVFDVRPAVLACRRQILRFDGVDTVADICLNHTHLGSPCNMHRIWEYDVTGFLNPTGNTLRVILHSPTKYIAEAYRKVPTRGTEDAMDGFVHLRKAHYMFGWDWGAHLPDAGLFRPVTLLGVEEGRIDHVYITQRHEEGRVILHFDAEIQREPDEEGLFYTVKVTAPDGEILEGAKEEHVLTIFRPQLWWPNGYGEQPLYQAEVTLFSEDGRELDRWSGRIGLRTFCVDRSEREDGENFAFCVNGVNLFAMGADYIPEDHLLGRVTPEKTRALLEKARWANFNSIRVWGGGYYPDDWFYDCCDELGLIVWQDFMFACALYDLTPAFEENVRAEITDNIKRLRHHACLGLWCGNNEMESFLAEGTPWQRKVSERRDYLILFERILPELVRCYDPERFYWPSSPSSGGSFDDPQDPARGDVHYWEVWHGGKPFTEYRNHTFRFLSEFGFQSFPLMKTVETFTEEKDRNIFSYVMEKHQRNGSANGKIMSYMQQMYLYPSDFSTVLFASQLLQADGIRYGVEHFRRNRGRCMGTIYWQLNDCWPVASWSSVDFCGRLKALHYCARRFFAPLLLSCEEQGMLSANEELNRQHFDEFEKSIRLNVSNETRQRQAGTVHWALRGADAGIIQSGEQDMEVPALTSVWLEKLAFPEADPFTQYVSYALEQDGEIVSEGTVLFSYPKYFSFLDPQIFCEVEGDELVVHAKAYAKSVEILNEQEDLLLSDNYFDMNAGEKRVKIISGAPEGLRLRSVYDIR